MQLFTSDYKHLISSVQQVEEGKFIGHKGQFKNNFPFSEKEDERNSIKNGSIGTLKSSTGHVTVLSCWHLRLMMNGFQSCHGHGILHLTGSPKMTACHLMQKSSPSFTASTFPLPVLTNSRLPCSPEGLVPQLLLVIWEVKKDIY